MSLTIHGTLSIYERALEQKFTVLDKCLTVIYEWASCSTIFEWALAQKCLR